MMSTDGATDRVPLAAFVDADIVFVDRHAVDDCHAGRDPGACDHEHDPLPAIFVDIPRKFESDYYCPLCGMHLTQLGTHVENAPETTIGSVAAVECDSA